MKREILKGFTMLMLLVALAFAIAVVSANAQHANTVLANIPFEFVVGDKKLPAGRYTLRSANQPRDALIIQGVKNGQSAIRMISSTAQEKEGTDARLVFHRYGQNYFLAEVWNGESDGLRLAKSNQERSIKRELAAIPSKIDLSQRAYEIVEVVAVLR